MSRKFLPVPRFRLKPRKGQDIDEAYKAFIRSLPCLICGMLRCRQTTKTEAAHVGQRGLAQKCSDRETIPLCALHHREGEHAHHRMGKKFWIHWNLERSEVILRYQRMFERQKAA